MKARQLLVKEFLKLLDGQEAKDMAKLEARVKLSDGVEVLISVYIEREKQVILKLVKG